MNALPSAIGTNADLPPDAADEELDPGDDWLLLSDPDLSEVERQLVLNALEQPRLSSGLMVEHFERQFAAYLGRAQAVAVASGTVGMLMVLRALGLKADDEVIAPAYSWHQTAHAVHWAGAKVVFSDIDYWCGCIDAEHVAQRITPATKAIIAANVNGHPAAWAGLRELATQHDLVLIEDSTEAIGSRYQGRMVGSFGDVAVFDFSQPGILCCGEGGMLVTDDERLASELRYLRARSLGDRHAIGVGARVPLQAGMSELTAALGAGQLVRLPEILARRKEVEAVYLEQISSFEGIKPPYYAPDVEEVYWMTWLVHLGKRFTLSATQELVEDMADECIEAAIYCQPLHQQHHYQQLGHQRGQLPLTERIADRALVLPLHGHLTPDQVKFIVKTLKDASSNVGAGAAIY